MNALEMLSQMDLIARQRKYPNTPGYALVKRFFHDTTANALTTAIIRFLELRNHPCWRQSSEGRYRPGEQYVDVLGHRKQLPGKWLPGQNKGAGDISAVIHGRFVSVEVKIGRDRQSSGQKAFQEMIENSGGHYVVAESFQDFINAYEKIAGKRGFSESSIPAR